MNGATQIDRFGEESRLAGSRVSSERMTARQAAAILGVSERTVRRAIASGRLAAVKRGGSFQITASELERYAASRGLTTHSDSWAGPVRSRPGGPPPVALLPGSLKPTPLPASLSRFIGRHDENATLSALLRDPAVRILTLTGPGGIGKSRLAIEAARATGNAFPDGSVFVGLADVDRPEAVLPTTGLALGLREGRTSELRERLRAFLRSRRILLLIDNFEQVLDAAPLVAEMVADAPGLTVLVTSRAPLRLAGELLFPVPPLSLKSVSRHEEPQIQARSAHRSDAVWLFSARASDPAVLVDEDTAPVVAQICARLDGLPLAIELAAARIHVLPPRELLSRLDKRLPLLTGGPRDAPARHQTMRSAIAWSHDLLNHAEQVTFRRLAVFAGGFTLDAAESVTGEMAGTQDGKAGSNPFDAQRSTLDSVSTLLEQSLLSRSLGPGGVPRFRMLDTVHEFALDQLAASGELDVMRRRHRQFFLSLAERAVASVRAGLAEADAVFDQLEAEHANARAALRQCDLDDDVGGLLRFVNALQEFWFSNCHYREGREWLERAVATSIGRQTPDRAWTLVALARLAAYQGDRDTAEARFAEGIPFIRDLGESLNTARVLIWQGSLAYHRGEPERAEHLLSEALALAQSVSGGSGPGVVAAAIANLGIAAQERGDLALAEARHLEALRRYSSAGQAHGVTISMLDLALVASDQGNHLLALERSRAVLSRVGERGDKRLVADAWEAIAAAAVAWGEADRAARLMGAAEALRERIGMPIVVPSDQRRHERTVAMLRANLEDDRLAAAWAEGLTLTGKQAEDDAALVQPESRAGRALDAALTDRELEVLRLLSGFRTDREIGEILFLSPRTVSWHVSGILRKLGVATRRQAAALARERGLG